MICYVDGGYNNNNKSDGYGSFAAFDSNGNLIDKISFLLPEANSSNEAEYYSLSYLITWLEANNLPSEKDGCIIYSDSRLMINQVNGYWKVRASNLQVLVDKIKLPPYTKLDWVDRNRIVDVLGH